MISMQMRLIIRQLYVRYAGRGGKKLAMVHVQLILTGQTKNVSYLKLLTRHLVI